MSNNRDDDSKIVPDNWAPFTLKDLKDVVEQLRQGKYGRESIIEEDEDGMITIYVPRGKTMKPSDTHEDYKSAHDTHATHEHDKAKTPKVFDTHEDITALGPLRCRKTVIVQAVHMNEAFAVKSKEGVVEGKPGDYLMRGVDAELYVCSKEVWDKSYEWVS